MRNLCIVAAICISFFSFGQAPQILKYEKKDGIMSNRYNFHLLEDSRGFLWSASDMGVFRYDGNTFDHFGIYEGLPDRTSLRLVEDPNGRLWVQTFSGGFAFNQQDTFVPYEYNERIKHLTKNDHTWHFQVDRNNTLYLGTDKKGLWMMDARGKLSNPIPCENKWKGVGIWFSDSLPPIIFGLMDTLDRLLLNNELHLFDNHFKHTLTIPVKLPDNKANYRSFFTQCRDETTIVSFGPHLFKFTRNRLVEQAQQPTLINAVCEDRDGNLWVATIDSGIVFYPKGHLNSGNEKHYFCGITVNWITQDKEGGIWLSVKGQGVWYLPSPFIHQLVLPSSIAGRYADFVMTVSDNFVYLAGSDNNVLRMPNGNNGVTAPVVSFSVPHTQRIRDLLWDDIKKRLYVVHTNGFGYFDESGSYHAQFLSDSLHYLGPALQIHPAGQDAVWVITHDGAARIRDHSITKIIHTPGNRNIHIASSPDGRYWLGGEGGVWYNHGDTSLFLGNQNPLFKGRIHGVMFHHNRLWVANSRLGMAVFDNNRLIKQWASLSAGHNLISHADTLWVTEGPNLIKVVCYNNDSFVLEKRRINYDDNSYLDQVRLHKGHFWASLESGLLHFHKTDLFQSRIDPPVYITKLSINGRDTTLLSNYVLTHTQNYLSITYTGISFHTLNMNFRYRLQGENGDWHYANQQMIQYINLPPGHYTFEVAAQTHEGIWSTQPASVSFTIRPPFWATWWFRTMLALIVAALVAAIFQLRFRRLKARGEMEQQLMLLESKALRAQINPHFIFNVLTAIQDYVSNGDTVASEVYLVKFSRLIRLILENSRQGFILLSRELEILEHYLEMERMRFKNRFSFSIHVESNIDTDEVSLPPMLIQPFVENAILHGIGSKVKNGHIHLKFELENNNSLRCEVTDNGVGRRAELYPDMAKERHQPLGLLITRERLQLLNHSFNQQLEIEFVDLKSHEPSESGTKVIIHIPILQNHEPI